jgi:RNA polymerase sigma-70 factor (ECF subfamily)
MLTSPQHYLRRIATNLLRDWETVLQPAWPDQKPLSDAAELPGDSDQHRALAAREDLAFCEKLLLELEPLDREIFLLNRVDGYSFRDIGKRMGLSEWAVKRNMLKTLGHLMARMDDR